MKGHFCSPCKKRLICCEYVDQPLFRHSIPSQLAQSFFSKPPGMKSQPHLAQVHMCYGLQSRLPVSLQYFPASSAPKQSEMLVLDMPTSCHWSDFFFLVSKKSGNISWMVYASSVLWSLSCILNLKISRRNLFCFVFFLPHHGNFVAPRWLAHPLLRGLVFCFFLNFKTGKSANLLNVFIFFLLVSGVHVGFKWCMLFPVNYLVPQWEVLELASEFTGLELPLFLIIVWGIQLYLLPREKGRAENNSSCLSFSFR